MKFLQYWVRMCISLDHVVGRTDFFPMVTAFLAFKLLFPDCVSCYAQV